MVIVSARRDTHDEMHSPMSDFVFEDLAMRLFGFWFHFHRLLYQPIRLLFVLFFFRCLFSTSPCVG